MKRFGWEPGFDSARILRNLMDCRNISADGRVSFNSVPYHFWLPILESSLRVSAEVSQHLKHACITRSVNDANVSLKDTDAFLARCETALNQLSARQKKQFIVYFSLTYADAPLFRNVIDGDVSLQWQSTNSKLLRNIRKAQSDLEQRLRNSKVAAEPDDCAYLLAKVSAYDVRDAYTLAADSVDCLRGMINLFVNSNLGINPFGGLSRPRAMNKFRAGPYRTIHKLDGTLATETFWYEHPWLHELPSMKFKQGHAAQFSKHLRIWWRRLQRNPLKNHVKQGLMRYCRALDTHDAEVSLTEVWSMLESLTGTQRERGDLTVDRTVQVFSDRDDARQVANHIRIRRNATVHAARSLDQHEADAILVHAEVLASRILFFCLEEGWRFKDTQELYNFLDLRLDRSTIKRTLALSRFFVKYQSRKRKK